MARGPGSRSGEPGGNPTAVPWALGVRYDRGLMVDPADPRYLLIVEDHVRRSAPCVATRETPTVVQVERATVLADAGLGRPVVPVPDRADVVDAAGHRRPVYRPVLAYAARAAGVGGPRLPDRPSAGDVRFAAAAGAAAAAAVWSALAQRTGATFRRLIDGQRPSGAFLSATSSDNPEVHWYHELVILHAAADRAIETGDADLWAAVGRATLFHLNETETDHATGQPWGLPAFVRVPGAGPLADAALHAVSAHQPGGAGGLTLFLLADTLYGARPRSAP